MEGWEEALDVDDSDLLSLRPSAPSPVHCISLSSISPLRRGAQISQISQSRSQNPSLQKPPPAADREAEEAALTPQRRIPGPAGAVLAAMHRQAAVAQDRNGRLLEERERGRAFDDEADEVDEDFVQNPWLCALDFLGGDGSPAERSIDSIKALGSAERAIKLVGIVTSCKSNGLGDLFVNLKDPTGTIGASVQRKVLTSGNFGVDLSIGCVLVLKQVAVFYPSPTTSYLNITLKNVVKIFGKDSGPPTRRIPLISTIRSPSSSDGLKRIPSAPPDGIAGKKLDLWVPSPERKKLTAATDGEVAVQLGGEIGAKVTAPQWTDEELSLLFSDDQDLADFPF